MKDINIGMRMLDCFRDSKQSEVVVEICLKVQIMTKMMIHDQPTHTQKRFCHITVVLVVV